MWCVGREGGPHGQAFSFGWRIPWSFEVAAGSSQGGRRESRLTGLTFPSLDTVCGTRSPGEGSPAAGRSLTSEKAWAHFKPHLGVKLLVGSGKGSPLWHYGVDYV